MIKELGSPQSRPSDDQLWGQIGTAAKAIIDSQLNNYTWYLLSGLTAEVLLMKPTRRMLTDHLDEWSDSTNRTDFIINKVEYNLAQVEHFGSKLWFLNKEIRYLLKV
jgi:hypothetical protein